MTGKLLLVGAGGFLGSVLRYLASGLVQAASGSAGFPWGTVAVNLAGCFAIGFLSLAGETGALPGGEARLFLMVGLLGGFTTFSTFGNETLNLLRDGGSLPALANVAAQVVVGLGLVWAGRALALAIWR